MRHFHTGCITTCLLVCMSLAGCGRPSADVSELADLTSDNQSAQTIRDVEQADSDVPIVVPATAPESAPRSSIAVIDVNDVAARVGVLDDINQRVRQKELAAQAQFTALQSQFAREYAAAQQQIGPEPTEQDQVQLYALQQRHMQELNAQWHLLQNEVVDLHNELKQDFLDSVRAVALAVAKNNGMTTVLTTSQVFSMDDQADITVDVAELMSKILVASQNPTEEIPDSKQIPELIEKR